MQLMPSKLISWQRFNALAIWIPITAMMGVVNAAMQTPLPLPMWGIVTCFIIDVLCAIQLYRALKWSSKNVLLHKMIVQETNGKTGEEQHLNIMARYNLYGARVLTEDERVIMQEEAIAISKKYNLPVTAWELDNRE